MANVRKRKENKPRSGGAGDKPSKKKSAGGSDK